LDPPATHGRRARAWECAHDGAAPLSQGDTSGYVNFLGDEGEARIRAAYPGSTWDRLTAIKRRYDPTNLFRYATDVRRHPSRSFLPLIACSRRSITCYYRALR
jgi:hypothetical protein